MLLQGSRRKRVPPLQNAPVTDPCGVDGGYRPVFFVHASLADASFGVVPRMQGWPGDCTVSTDAINCCICACHSNACFFMR